MAVYERSQRRTDKTPQAKNILDNFVVVVSFGLLQDLLCFPECPTGDSVVPESINVVPLAG